MAANLNELLEQVEKSFSDSISTLLADRYIYQTQEISTAALEDLIRQPSEVVEPPTDEEEEFERMHGPLPRGNSNELVFETLERIANMRWMLVDPNRWASHYEGKLPKDRGEVPTIKLPRFIRACSQCKVPSSPFTPGGGQGFPSSVIQETMTRSPRGQPVQTWFLTYRCRSCDNEPLYLMLRRVGFKLSITGRNLFESIDIPKSIPKGIKRYYRESLVARNGGKGLAAALYLRVALEQYMRNATGTTDRKRGEDLADEYSRLLHPEFPPSLRNLRTIYEALSVQIHSGEANPEAFDESLAGLNRHFDQLVILPLPEGSKSVNAQEDDDD